MESLFSFIEGLQLQGLNTLLPIGAAFLASTAAVLVSSAYARDMKSLAQYQAASFGGALALSMYTLSHQRENGDLMELVSILRRLAVESPVTLFCLSLFVIGTSYFGCAFYLSPSASVSASASTAGGAGQIMEMPASSDSCVSFDVPKVLSADDKTLFEQQFETICAEIVGDLPTVYEMPPAAVTWVKDMLAYTVAGGKMNRGLALMSVQDTLAKWSRRKLSNRERVQSAALGWCIEFLQAFFLVADDIMDGSKMRRGQPCWYRNDSVGLVAINDSFILESCVFKILKRYFGTEPYYLQVLDLFLEVTRQTELGQLLDLTSQPPGEKIDLNRFTMHRLKSIFKYKTAFYSFYLPVALGMIISGVRDVAMYDKAREILCIMGEYFQIQDDYLDCFGTPADIGKIGTDIQDNKNSWLVVTALQKCTPKQRKVLNDNYGKDDAACIEAVKQLYREMNMKDEFDRYEASSYETIKMLIHDYKELPTEVFEFLLRKIYKRSK